MMRAAQSVEDHCRICFRGESYHNLIQPCNCKGSIKWVHRECLEKWLRQKTDPKCEVCKLRYQVERFPRSWRDWWKSTANTTYRRELVKDGLYMLALMPMYAVGVGLCIYLNFYNKQLYSKMDLKMLLLLMVTIFQIICSLIYVTWCAVFIGGNWYIAQRWRMTNGELMLVFRDDPGWRQSKAERAESRVPRERIGSTDHATQRTGPTDHAVGRGEPTDIVTQRIGPTDHASERVSPTNLRTEAIGTTDLATLRIGPIDNAIGRGEPMDITTEIIGPTHPATGRIAPKNIATEGIGPRGHATLRISPTNLATEAIGSTDVAIERVDPTDEATGRIGTTDLTTEREESIVFPVVGVHTIFSRNATTGEGASTADVAEGDGIWLIFQDPDPTSGDSPTASVTAGSTSDVSTEEAENNYVWVILRNPADPSDVIPSAPVEVASDTGRDTNNLLVVSLQQGPGNVNASYEPGLLDTNSIDKDGIKNNETVEEHHETFSARYNCLEQERRSDIFDPLFRDLTETSFVQDRSTLSNAQNTFSLVGYKASLPGGIANDSVICAEQQEQDDIVEPSEQDGSMMSIVEAEETRSEPTDTVDYSNLVESTVCPLVKSGSEAALPKDTTDVNIVSLKEEELGVRTSYATFLLTCLDRKIGENKSKDNSDHLKTDIILEKLKDMVQENLEDIFEPGLSSPNISKSTGSNEIYPDADTASQTCNIEVFTDIHSLESPASILAENPEKISESNSITNIFGNLFGDQNNDMGLNNIQSDAHGVIIRHYSPEIRSNEYTTERISLSSEPSDEDHALCMQWTNVEETPRNSNSRTIFDEPNQRALSTDLANLEGNQAQSNSGQAEDETSYDSVVDKSFEEKL